MPALHWAIPPEHPKVATPDTPRRSDAPSRFSTLLTAASLAALIVVAGTIIFLSKDLPDASASTLNYPVTDFNFAFGSGSKDKDLMLVDQFANGYALLSSGAVSIQAGDHRILSYTWLPPQITQEAAFFWRVAGDPQNVSRTEITEPGTQLINLSAEPKWQGEIIEIGFLVAGENGKPVAVGEASLIPDSMKIRLQLAWRGWTSFEEWSQQSINFLYGGDYRQVIALPPLIAAWLLLSLLFTWLFHRFGSGIGSRHLLMTAGMLFLFAWLLLDIRWAANNIKQARLSLDTHLRTDEQQRMGSDMDGEIYQYAQRLKSSVLGKQNARILITGDENAIDYYLLRAKYHLLPHSVNVAGRLAADLAPESLDFVIFFGQPDNIINVPGWSQAWQSSLANVDSGNLAVVFKVTKQ